MESWGLGDGEGEDELKITNKWCKNGDDTLSNIALKIDY